MIKVVNADYYGHCNVNMYNVSNPCTVTVKNNGKTIFYQKACSYGGRWQSTCVDVPIIPGRNEIDIETSNMVWRGKNYTSVTVSPLKICNDAEIKQAKDVVVINGDVIECSEKGILVLHVVNRAVWGGYPAWNNCCATYCYGQIVMLAPCRHEMYYVTGNRLHKFTDLNSHIDWSGSYFLACKTAKIVREETYLVIDGKKCPPGRYTVYAGEKIPFVVTVTHEATVQVYDKLAKKILWQGKGKKIDGNITFNRNAQIEFRVIENNRIVDSYG